MAFHIASHAAMQKLSIEDKTRLAEEYYAKNEADLTAALRLAKGSPSLIGYCLYDEPASVLAQVLGRRFYHKVQEVDGYHPSFVVYSSTIPAGDENVDWMECLGTDPYWTPGESGPRGNVNYVSKITYLTRETCRAAAARSFGVCRWASTGVVSAKRAIMPRSNSADISGRHPRRQGDYLLSLAV